MFIASGDYNNDQRAVSNENNPINKRILIVFHYDYNNVLSGISLA